MSRRIVRYALSASAVEALPPCSCDRLPRLYRAGDEYTTANLAHDSAEAATFAALGFVEHDVTAEYAIGWTPAPRSYDHGYALQLEERDGRRLVAVPRDEVEAQCGRYASGLYGYGLEPDGAL